MQKLKTGGSSGPDGFPPQLFKKLSGSLAELGGAIVTDIFVFRVSWVYAARMGPRHSNTYL